MANLAYSSIIQDQVSTLLFGTSYATLQSSIKLGIDNTWTSGAPNGGAALSAWTQLNQYSQWWYQAGASVSPDAWQAWLVARICRIYATQARPDRVEQFRALEQQAQIDALQTFTVADPDASAISANVLTPTYKAVRFYVIRALLNRTPPLFASPDEVDNATLEVLRDLWNRADWIFKRRAVTVTIATGPTVTFSLTGGEVFNSFSTSELYYTDTPYRNIPLKFCNQDEMARRVIENNDTTGRPYYFRFSRTGITQINWQFAPQPDATYTAQGEVFIKGPDDPANSTSQTPFTQFPSEFIPVIKNAVLARVLYNRNTPDGRDALARVNDTIERIVPQYIDAGNVDTTPTPRDVHNDFITYGGVWGGGL